MRKRRTGHVTLIGIRTGFVAGIVVDEALSTSPATGDDVVKLPSSATTAAASSTAATAVSWRKSIESLPRTSVTSRPNVHGCAGRMSAV